MHLQQILTSLPLPRTRTRAGLQGVLFDMDGTEVIGSRWRALEPLFRRLPDRWQHWSAWTACGRLVAPCCPGKISNLGGPAACAKHNDRALTGNGVRPMNSTPQQLSAAGEHFADAERILAALPLIKRGADRDRQVQIALVHAVLAIVAGIHPTNGTPPHDEPVISSRCGGWAWYREPYEWWRPMPEKLQIPWRAQ